MYPFCLPPVQRDNLKTLFAGCGEPLIATRDPEATQRCQGGAADRYCDETFYDFIKAEGSEAQVWMTYMPMQGSGAGQQDFHHGRFG